MTIKEAIKKLYEKEMKVYVDSVVEDIVRRGPQVISIDGDNIEYQSEEDYQAELDFAKVEAENDFTTQTTFDMFEKYVMDETNPFFPMIQRRLTKLVYNND